MSISQLSNKLVKYKNIIKLKFNLNYNYYFLIFKKIALITLLKSRQKINNGRI